jgi:hypothetical protein
MEHVPTVYILSFADMQGKAMRTKPPPAAMTLNLGGHCDQEQGAKEWNSR